MANKKRGEVDISLDGGSPHILLFNYNKLCDLEEACGAPLMHLVDSGGKGVAMGFLREAVMYSITTLPEKQRTRKKIGSMLGNEMDFDPKAMLGISRAVMMAIGFGMGRTEEEILASFVSDDEEAGEAETDVPLPEALPVAESVPTLIGTGSGG